MCGIIAVATDSHAKTPDISKSLSAMARRGPDSEGEWTSPCGKTKLGHRRLSIVDLSEAGRQPMHNEDKSLWLVCNGEIYNYGWCVTARSIITLDYVKDLKDWGIIFILTVITK
jgi:asparagine synthase (glutamine-hydrolysing)